MTFKRTEIIILPTNKKAINQLLLHPPKIGGDPDRLECIKTSKYIEHIGSIGMSLYFLSNEEIKEGDWFINLILNKPFQCVEVLKDEMNGNIHFRDEKGSRVVNILNCKKIIATTDSSLILKCKCKSGVDWWHNSKTINCEHEIEDHYNKALRCDLKLDLPQPPQKFIELYVEEYNKGNVIKEVLVEYENRLNITKYVNVATDGNYEVTCPECNKYYHFMGTGDTFCFNHFYPKINSKDNTITIKKIKDNWNREEVLRLCEKARDHGERHREFLWKEFIEENI